MHAHVMITFFLCVLALITPGISLAGKIGPELKIVLEPDGVQWQPAVASFPDGRFVIIWETTYFDTSGRNELRGRIFNAQGIPVTGAFFVASETTDYVVWPSVATLSDDRFVVVWSSGVNSHRLTDIYGRIFKRNAKPAGDPFYINNRSRYQQRWPSVTRTSDDGFVVKWTEQTGFEQGTYGQRFNKKGKEIGGEFSILHDANCCISHDSTVAGLVDGGFVVTWRGMVDGKYQAFVQRFSKNGKKKAGPIIVATGRRVHGASIAALETGGYAVSWYYTSLRDSSRKFLGARSFSKSGKKVGKQFRYRLHDASENRPTSIAGIGNGGYAVVWGNRISEAIDRHAVAQRFSRNGKKRGGLLILNKTGADKERYPVVTGLNGNRYVAIWESNRPETEGYVLFGRRFK